MKGYHRKNERMNDLFYTITIFFVFLSFYTFSATVKDCLRRLSASAATP